MPMLKSTKKINISVRVTASFEKKTDAYETGSVCTCFQVLFLYSSWAIRLVVNIAPSGRKNTAIDSHELCQSLSQKSSFAYRAGTEAWLTSLATMIIAGVKNPPMMTIQSDRLRFVFIHSL